MKYKEPNSLTRAMVEVELGSGDPRRILEALVAVVLNDPDWRWVQEVCLTFAVSPDAGVRSICATSFGHLARIHGALDLARVLPVLKDLMSEAETEGYAETALDDIKMFMGHEEVERVWAESL